MRKNVAVRALWESRLMAEMNKPAASEKKSALRSATEVFQNCPPVTPPISNVVARIGKNASRGKKPRNEVARSFPATTSYPRRSVRKRKPRVPSRFSSLRESEVKKSPAASAAQTNSHIIALNTIPPGPDEPNPLTVKSQRQAAPIIRASEAAALRSQKELRVRAATRSSRSTIGRNVMVR